VLPAKKPRIVHTYTIPAIGQPVATTTPRPADLSKEAPWPPPYTGQDPWDGQEPLVRTIGIVALTGDEEDACFRSAAGDSRKAQRALVVASLKLVDGRPVETISFEGENLWAKVTPQVRELWLWAYNRHNTAERGLLDSFRASYTVEAS